VLGHAGQPLFHRFAAGLRDRGDHDARIRVAARQRRVFRNLAPESADDRRPTIGMNRSFLVNTYFPFYNRYFAELGYRLVLPDTIDPEGVDQRGAAFCFPVEIGHGYMKRLLDKNPDVVFLPHLRGLPTDADHTSCACVFVQAEPFYLRSAFPQLRERKVLSPFLDFSKGFVANSQTLAEVARELGAGEQQAQKALTAAIAEQETFHKDIKQLGTEMLVGLRAQPDRVAIVLFGRPYNAFAGEGNKGIPAKFASRGVAMIPFDMLPQGDQALEPDLNMYWGMGRLIMKASRLVRNDRQLFATYITNFSCGPDSFLVGYFRDNMGRKPSLTLELDSHTADAGIETRIEAFLDIVNYYRQIEKKGASSAIPRHSYHSARIDFRESKAGVLTSSDEWLPLTHERVKIVVPAMGRFGTPLLAAAFSRVGVRAAALPPADEEILKLGRGNSSCKECLPLQTTVGSILHYLKNIRPAGEVTAYFMPTAEGPCRFGQYNVYTRRIIAKHGIEDAAVLSLNSLNGYGGLGDRFTLAAWRAVIIGDLFDEMWSTVLAGASDKQAGLAILEEEYQRITSVIDKDWRRIGKQLTASAKRLSTIELNRPYSEIPKISLIGEIYVRHDPIALQRLIERLGERGFIVRTAQNSEWIKYVDWLVKTGIEGSRGFAYWVRHYVKHHFDRQVRSKLAPSGLFFHENFDVGELVNAGKRYISPRLTGEAILTVGSAFHEILHPACGIISIGPFGCMPTRVAEAILSERFTTTEKQLLLANNGHHRSRGIEQILSRERKLPFLAIETDGNAFPQVIEARLEAFCLQAQRLNDLLIAS